MMYYENYPKSLEESTNLTFTIVCDYLLQKLNDTASPSSAVVDGDEVEIISIKELLNATTHEIISRPPFSYLYEFIRVVFSSSSLVINITTCPETKTEKIRFLTRIISYLSLYDIKKEVKEGVPLNVLVSPVQIICGQNVMATHLFLRQLIQTKQKENYHDSDIIHYINQIGESHLYRKNVRIRNTFVRIQAIVRGWTFRKRKEISYLDHTSPCNSSGSREDRSLSENNNNNNISSITKRIRHNNQMLNQSLIELTNSKLLFSSPSPRRHTTTSCNGVDNGTDNIIIYNHNNNNNNNIQHFSQSKSKSSPSLKSSSFHLTERTTSYYNKNNKEKEMKLKILHDKYKQRLFTMKQQKESIQQEKLELEKQKEKVVLLANQLRKRQHSNIIKRRRESRQSKSQSELKHDIKKDNKDKKNNNNNKTTWVMLREEQNKQNQLLNQSKIPKPSSTHTTTHFIEKRELKLKKKKKDRVLKVAESLQKQQQQQLSLHNKNRKELELFHQQQQREKEYKHKEEDKIQTSQRKTI